MIEATLRLARRDFTLDVALTLPARGVTALFGPSGCGKTTVLRALAGLERAEGRVAVNGSVWQDGPRFVPPHQRPLGYVIQEAALFPHLSVRRNIEFGARRSGGLPAGMPRLIELLGIGALMERRPATLSGGERQRVAIARALAANPELLLMDEPLAALDASRKADILPYLERLQAELALPVVLVTHSMHEVAALAEHLVLMHAGRVTAAGPLTELLARPDLPVHDADDTGVVIDARVGAHDAAYGLMRVDFDGGALWVGATAAAVGERVRARVLARDVSVVLAPPRDTSILNVLPASVQGVHAEGPTALLALDVGATRLLARITKKSLDLLALKAGQAVHAQVKGVALM